MASTTSREEITQVYVSTFNRAPDAEGLDYWYESGLAIEQISASFFDQEETKEMYPTTMNNQTFVTAIYNNVFNHDPDTAGLEYWAGELDDGSISRANMILAIGNGATGTDEDILDNKTEVGLYYAGKQLNSLTTATAVMDSIDETDESVDVSKSYIDSITNFDLTTERDNIENGFLDDIMKGEIFSETQTYTKGDKIDGGEGDDMLILNMGVGGKDSLATIKNVETIKFVALSSDAAHEVDAGNWEDVETFEIANTQANRVISNISTPFEAIVIDGLNTTTITSFIVGNDVFSGSSDSLDFTLSYASASSMARLGVSNDDGESVIEKLNIITESNSGSVSSGDASSVSISPISTLEQITVDGDSDIALLTTGGNDITRVDASSLDAGIKYTVTGTSGTKVLGGTKNDILTAMVSGDTLDGGKGADTLISLAAVETKQTFAYANLGDSGTTTATADTIIDFETGVDKLTFTLLDAGSSSNFNNSDSIATTIESAVATANSGELEGYTYLFYANVTDSFLVIDGDEDGQADQAITLEGVTIFSYTDIE